MLNVIATGKAAVLTSGYSLILPPAIKVEALFVYTDSSRKTRVQIDDAELSRNGITFTHTTLSAGEIALFARLAARIDDGEAQALAIAAERGLNLLTDDNAAIREAPLNGVKVVTTLDLLYNWASATDGAEVKAAAQSLHDRGNYFPPRAHPHASWYRSLQ